MSTLTNYLTTIAFLFSGSQSYSDEQIKSLTEECKDFYKNEISYKYVEYLDHWTKKGKLVIALAVKDSPSSNSYTERLCIVNFKKGTI